MPVADTNLSPHITASEGYAWREEFYRVYRPSARADDFESSYPYLKKLIENHIPRDRGTRIADIGCGAGRLLAALQRHGYEKLVGVDVSDSQIATARSRGIAVIEQSDALQFLGGSSAAAFDVVISFDVIEHFRRDELLTFGREVYRVLAPGGRWLVHVPNAAAIFGNRVRYADVTHEQAFTAESLTQWSVLFGFSDTKCYEDKPVVHGVRSLVRRVVWGAARTCAAACLIAESGPLAKLILSQNILAVLQK